MKNPLTTERRRDRLGLACAIAAVGASIGWAMWPLEDPEPTVDLTTESPSTGPAMDDSAPPTRTPLDVDSFEQAILWPIIEEPDVAPEPEPAGPPTELRLLGISQSDAGLRATVYDITHDRVLSLAKDEEIGDLRVTSVSETEIGFEQRGRRGTWKLESAPRSLREGGS